MFSCSVSEKNNLVLKIYVEVSNFALEVNFFVFQKDLVIYATPSIYCSSFYCIIRFYLVVDMVFVNLPKSLINHAPVLQVSDVSDSA